MTTCYTYFESPIGLLLLTSNGEALTGLYMIAHKHGPEIGPDWQQNVDDLAVFIEAKAQLLAYFDGTLTEFRLPLSAQGTEFQKQVWEELQKIPYGSTLSYKELALRIGNPKGVRAVGLANGRNPISIIVPCHRVIGASGKLTGYSGGLSRKEALLMWESSVVAKRSGSFASHSGGDT
ncbi:MAG: methylated-DNA--[protein]-cysteine S-methyltransferase [Chroococcidiopsidaceae cyanobacterium CP_BM_ER_R8_30]|nr:methylated-DNA--[protein]-cysteine S-methyltransferase [Chroococcidiopsidaceae cyanobacterium CP_BM_ER_R8_30]